MANVTHKNSALQVMVSTPWGSVHTPWGQVVRDPESFAVMPGCDSVLIVGLVTLDKLGLNLNSQMFLLDIEREGFFRYPASRPPTSCQVAEWLSQYRYSKMRGR